MFLAGEEIPERDGFLGSLAVQGGDLSVGEYFDVAGGPDVVYGALRNRDLQRFASDDEGDFACEARETDAALPVDLLPPTRKPCSPPEGSASLTLAA